jgi:hypothetical protein
MYVAESDGTPEGAQPSQSRLHGEYTIETYQRYKNVRIFRPYSRNDENVPMILTQKSLYISVDAAMVFL